MLTEEGLASFWEHVEELRHTFVRIFFIIGIGVIATLFFYQPLFQVLVASAQSNLTVSPLKQKEQKEKIINPHVYNIIYSLPDQALIMRTEGRIEQIFPNQYLLHPHASIEYKRWVQNEASLLILSPLEGISLTFKICFWVGLVLTAPFWGYQLFLFILPALKQHEKLAVIPFFIGSLICLGLGMTCAYLITIPIANSYLRAFNQQIGENIWTLSAYIDYTFILMLGHAIAFELCLILLFCVHFSLLDAQVLSSKRRYMIVSAFILGALLTPPDVLTQCMLAVPLIAMYEIAILYSKLRAKRLFVLNYLTRT